MDKKDILKKYWFIGVVAAMMLIFLGVYCADAIKNREVRINTKTVDGQYAILAVGDDYLLADELYDSLYASTGVSAAFNSYANAVIDAAVKTTDDISTYVANYAYYITQNNTEESIDSALRQYGYNGYNDLNTYCMMVVKQQELLRKFYEDNYDEYIQPLIDEERPLNISHILIKVADVEQIKDEDGNVVEYIPHPTDEEQKKLDEVLELLKTEEFSEVALTHSEDTSSAQNGGSLGINFISTLDNYVPNFKKACLEIKAGETSDVIVTEYGYHIIKAEEADTSNLLENSDFTSLIDKKYPNLTLKVIVDKGEELGFIIADEDLKHEITSLLEAE
ncbi:MAG: peptidylprolyl isomerase [Erysipelotrichaceae bacterium]|nr:peptidylprolyl isomerase [Erysipelotrichaceae bacterium]